MLTLQNFVQNARISSAYLMRLSAAAGAYCLMNLTLSVYLPSSKNTVQSVDLRFYFCPKFHCELNPLEMVWGRSKYHYHLNPPSTKEEDLERNMINALDSVTIDEMRR